MQPILYQNPIMRKVVRQWRNLGILLFILLLVKNMIVIIDFNSDNMVLETGDLFADNSPYRIHINLDVQTMYVYKNGQLYKTYPVSGGKNKSPSPTGEWVIIHKARWGDGFGGAWMGLNVPWGKYGIHGTRAPWAIGRQNVSGGCIRMNNDDANELYEFIPHGTKVTIVYENQPFRNLKDGDVGSDVYQVQKALKQLGYFRNWCDGKYGAETKKAVLAYQKDAELAQTGVVNISTWQKLMKQYDESLLE